MIFPPPPPPLEPFVRLIGPELTLRLLETHGGTRIFVPLVRGGGYLSRDLTAEAEAALISEFGGCWISVPLAKGWRAVIYDSEGMDIRRIALKDRLNTAPGEPLSRRCHERAAQLERLAGVAGLSVAAAGR
jgi:hypothetical protein